MASYSEVVVEWTVGENEAERVYIALSQSRLLQFEKCFNVIYGSKRAVSKKHVMEWKPYNEKKSKTIH